MNAAGNSSIRVVELRRYTLHPGQRDVLIELFDRDFVETQEATGMRIYGQFRDASDPDQFVWVRGFTDMEVRKRALTEFYTGPVWKANSAAANATMVAVDNVLLLRPVGVGFELPDPAERPPVGSEPPTTALVAVAVPVAASSPSGGELLATFETDPAENSFPALPVRTGEDVRVTFHRFPSLPDARAFAATLDGHEHAVLLPTGRSQLR